MTGDPFGRLAGKPVDEEAGIMRSWTNESSWRRWRATMLGQPERASLLSDAISVELTLQLRVCVCVRACV